MCRSRVHMPGHGCPNVKQYAGGYASRMHNFPSTEAYSVGQKDREREQNVPRDAVRTLFPDPCGHGVLVTCPVKDGGRVRRTMGRCREVVWTAVHRRVCTVVWVNRTEASGPIHLLSSLPSPFPDQKVPASTSAVGNASTSSTKKCIPLNAP